MNLVLRFLTYNSEGHDIETEPIKYSSKKKLVNLFCKYVELAYKNKRPKFYFLDYCLLTNSYVNLDGDIIPWKIPIHTVDEWFRRYGRKIEI